MSCLRQVLLVDSVEKTPHAENPLKSAHLSISFSVTAVVIVVGVVTSAIAVPVVGIVNGDGVDIRRVKFCLRYQFVRGEQAQKN